MHLPEKFLTRAAIGLAACVMSLSALAQVPHISTDSNVPPATARQQAAEVAQGGPARWSIPDVTVEQRLRTIRKEAGAGLQENLGNCRKLATAERGDCVRQARKIYAEEMAGAKARAMADDQVAAP